MRIDKLFINLPRHPLWRAFAVIAGSVLLIGLITLGLLIGVAGIAVAALTMLIRGWRIRGWRTGRRRRRADSNVIEGEFTVVSPRPRVSLPRTD